jgi:hypothetical protein
MQSRGFLIVTNTKGREEFLHYQKETYHGVVRVWTEEIAKALRYSSFGKAAKAARSVAYGCHVVELYEDTARFCTFFRQAYRGKGEVG